MNDHDPSTVIARICIICGDLFVPEQPHFRTCSMRCSVDRVEQALDQLAQHLAGTETKK